LSLAKPAQGMGMKVLGDFTADAGRLAAIETTLFSSYFTG